MSEQPNTVSNEELDAIVNDILREYRWTFEMLRESDSGDGPKKGQQTKEAMRCAAEARQSARARRGSRRY